MFSAASGNYLAEHNSNLPLTWLSVASPHQCILAPLASQTLQGPLSDTPFSPGLERSENEMTEPGAPPTPLYSSLYNEP